MSARGVILAGVVALVGLGGFLLLSTTTVTDSGVHIGKVPAAQACSEKDCLPDLTVTTIDGRRLATKELVGKVVLVNFWATWCAPCVQEMPALEAVAKAHADDLVILGVAVDGTDESLRAVAAERGVSYPIVRTSALVERALGRPQYLPTSFIYGKDGHLRSQWSKGVTEAELEAKLAPALSP
jgi:thiol-disulfide isomerase/thioredoxin